MKKILLILFLAILLQLKNNVFAYDNQANANVNVTFRVDMSGQNVSNGVYLNGSPTAWLFTPMSKEGNTNIYSVIVNLIPGEKHVYYYRNVADWNASSREVVPSDCSNSMALWGWTGDRAFYTPTNDSIISNTYSSCATISSSTALIDNFVQGDIQIFPNPVKDILSIMLPEDMKEASINIYSLDGRKVITNQQVARSLDIKICVSDIKSGLYLLEIRNKQRIFVRKINIQ